MITVTIVGKGNVGTHLYEKFSTVNSLEVSFIDSRKVGTIKHSDITILAVSDDAIPDVSSEITSSFVVHTSGNVSINQLKNASRKGVFYPLQSFTKGKEIDFSNIPLCIEAENTEDLALLEKLVDAIGAKSYQINSNQRKKIHVAAVFANNFTNHMYALAKEICELYEIPFEILFPLIEETATKAKDLGPLKAQTGPAVRNDLETIKNHLNLLNSNQQEIYQLLTDSIQKHGKKL